MKANKISKKLVIKENLFLIMELISAIFSIAASYICFKGLNAIVCVLTLIVASILIAIILIKRLQNIRAMNEISSFIADNKTNFNINRKTNVINLEDEREYMFLKLSNKMSHLPCYKLQKYITDYYNRKATLDLKAPQL